jgi:hypothetical protein
MTPEQTIRAYYDALRAGEPLAPFFAERSDLVKFGISERLEGFEGVSRGLREQTRTTTDWSVESRRLRVDRRGAVAWFSDGVAMAWTDSEAGERRAFETRWSGALERRRSDERDTEAGTGTETEAETGAEDSERSDADSKVDAEADADAAAAASGGWRFVGMHVSAPHDL